MGRRPPAGLIEVEAYARTMVTSPILSLFEPINPLRLAGPLLDRELRVSSRRRRTYLLRIGYVALMGAFALAAWCWIMMRPTAPGAVFIASRSSEVGLRITQSILWFQFLAAQLIAAAMLSSSLTDEIHRGGLDVLLTTPITSIQVVLGKLLSRLWQILLLMALSLPALAVVRLMGGVSWDMLAGSFCITLTAVLFIGALCLWLSTHCRHPHQVISTAAAVYLVLFVALPGVITLTTSLAGLNASAIKTVTYLISPRQALYGCMYPAFLTRGPGPAPFFSWPLHCAIMLGLTMVLLGVCVWRIRRVSIWTAGSRRRGARRRTRRHRCPIVWRELTAHASRRRWHAWLLVGVAAALCLLSILARVKLNLTYEVITSINDLAWAFWMVALLRLAVLAAGAIGREKDGGAWPLLLTTPLDEKRIVRGKQRAVVKLTLLWLLAAFVVRLSVGLVFNYGWDWSASIALVCYIPSLVSSAFLVMAAGLYFGLRLKTTMGAIIATLAVYLFTHHFLGGSYNPLYAWLRAKAVMRFQSNPNSVVLVHFGTLGAVALLQIVLGVLLLRRTRMTLRCGV